MTNIPRDADEENRETVRIRRAPRFSVFMLCGAALGLIASFVLVGLNPIDPNVGYGATFGYFALFVIPLGLVLGALVAIIIDRVSTKRAVRVVAGKLEVHVDDAQNPSNNE
ncbi:MAG: hypothetical protein KF742_02085 [Cryobacterium sp.]|nr:hypothetical protein [Cryobacterium sp.]MBX3089749.1 hypothetical protein [Cryobacterium sp.]MBX3116090.1 hypothetical protein [Cryobacterium sp.]MCO5295024.1 hypothetical protein [Homoserinimonas sp.]MCW5944938.1 hypothetical protein [Cryobacterium sp.]